MTKKIKGLDGIRGLAVLSVVFSHSGAFYLLDSTPYMQKSVLPLVHGPTGVQAFFVLSGFLITMLLIKEYQANGSISIGGFFYRRVLRIIPLYLLFLVAVIALHLVYKDLTTWRSLFYASTYTYNFVPTYFYSSILGHTWSLAVEEHFYLVWPFIFSAVFATRKNGLIYGLIGFFILSYIARLTLAEMWWLENFYFIDRWTIIAGSNIALGCLGALLLYGGTHGQFWSGILKSNAMLGIGILLYLNSLLLGSFYISPYLRGIGIALFIIWICLNQESRLTRCLEIRSLQYIGLISYGIYMYQGLFLGTGPARAPGQAWPHDIWTGLLLLAITAPLSYHFFEKPFLRLKSKYSMIKAQ